MGLCVSVAQRQLNEEKYRVAASDKGAATSTLSRHFGDFQSDCLSENKRACFLKLSTARPRSVWAVFAWLLDIHIF